MTNVKSTCITCHRNFNTEMTFQEHPCIKDVMKLSLEELRVRLEKYEEKKK